MGKRIIPVPAAFRKLNADARDPLGRVCGGGSGIDRKP
jgi:hypothetical protein